MEDESRQTPGKTTIAPDVLLTIARLATLGEEGVNRLSPIPGGVNRLFKRNQSQGVQINIESGIVNVDLFVVLDPETNVREVSRNIQKAVSRAISEMVGMEVGKINVHIEDINFPDS